MRALAPAAFNASELLDVQTVQRKPPRATVTQACVACRRRKSRCNGGVPCAQCQNKGTECEYIGRPRPHEMRKSLQDKDAKLDDYLQLINTLRTATNEHACNVLQRLRDVEDIDDLISDLRDEAEVHQGAGRSDTATLLPLGWSRTANVSQGITEHDGTQNERMHVSVWHPALQIRTTLAQPHINVYQDSSPIYNELSSPDLAQFNPNAFSQHYLAYQNVNQGHNDSVLALPGLPRYSGTQSDEGFALYEPDHSKHFLDAFNGCSLQDLEQSRHMILPSQPLDEQGHHKTHPSNGYIQVYGNLSVLNSMLAGYCTEDTKERQENLRIPIHLIQPLSQYEDSALARAWLDYRDDARIWIAKRQYSIDRVLGSDDIQVDLVFGSESSSDQHSVPAWACNFTRAFHEGDDYTRLACIALFTRLMRWMINPTPEMHARVPDMMKPTLAQRLIPHSPTIDFVLFPCVRDHLITNFQDFLSILSGNYSVDWTQGFDNAVFTDPISNMRTLTPQFEEHISQLKNWSVSSSCADIFPELKESVKIQPPSRLTN